MSDFDQSIRPTVLIWGSKSALESSASTAVRLGAPSAHREAHSTQPFMRSRARHLESAPLSRLASTSSQM